MEPDETLTIGAVARASDVPVRTLRFYEERGLIVPRGRSAKGDRLYGREALDDLAFLKAAKRLDLALEQIGELLRIRNQGRCPCGRTWELLEARLSEVEAARDELGRLRDELRRALRAPNRKEPAVLPCRSAGRGHRTRG